MLCMGGGDYKKDKKKKKHDVVESASDMELRDYFAAKALQAHLSIPTTHEGVARKKYSQEDVADACYIWADEMMKARDK